MGLKERREREKELKRQHILNAARKLLLEKGYYNISIRQIATLAEIGVGTIYSYFKSKEDIYAVLSEEVFDLLYHTMNSAADKASGPVDKIRRTGEALLEFSNDHCMYYDFIDYFISTPQVIFPNDIKDHVDYYGKRIIEPVSMVISDGIAEGVFRDVDPGQYALIFFGSVHGFIHFRKLKNTVLKNEDFQELFRSNLECFIAGIMRNQ